MTGQPRVYSYWRFSSAKQELGDSKRRQNHLRDEWLARKGWTLDDSLAIADQAVSAFRGKNLSEGPLGEFIKQVHAGRVPKGSYLIIEKIDRFTRFEPDEALPVFTRLLKAGIIIVTLANNHEWTTESIKNFGIMQLLVELLIAHGESKGKSERLAAVWQEKKRKAADQLVTTRLPDWLMLKDGKPVADPDKVKLMLRIIGLAEAGHGSSQIATMLNQEKIPSFSWGDGWHGSSIGKKLRNRALIGEYQRCKITPLGPTRRVPDGEPVPNYYPAIISVERFNRLQLAIDGRTLARGECGRHVSNLFTDLMVDARTGGGLFCKKLARSHYFLPQSQRRGLAEYKFSFSYEAIEKAFLQFFHELKLSDLQPPTQKTDKSESNHARLLELERMIAKTSARAKKSANIDSILDMLESLEAEKKELQALIMQEQSVSVQTQQQNLTEAKSILDLLANTKGDELLDLRARLKNLIRSMVNKIYLLVDAWGGGKVAFMQVNFKSGGCRMMTIFDAGKGVKLKEELTVGFKEQRPIMPLVDLSKWQTDKVVRDWYQQGISTLQNLSVQSIATKRMLAGELPYLVAKDLGISNATCYRWKDIATGKPLKPRKPR